MPLLEQSCQALKHVDLYMLEALKCIDRGLCLQAGHLLGQLLEVHPAMKLIVVNEAEQFVFRRHLPKKAIYYTIVFLNQLPLTKDVKTGMWSVLDSYKRASEFYVLMYPYTSNLERVNMTMHKVSYLFTGSLQVLVTSLAEGHCCWATVQHLSGEQGNNDKLCSSIYLGI